MKIYSIPISPTDAGEKARDEKIVPDILRWEICRSEDDSRSSLRCAAPDFKAMPRGGTIGS
jgi:hypothetical protein